MGSDSVRRRTAVIADDERSARVLVRAALEPLGYEVVDEVGTGIEAIRAAATHEPHVVVLDQMMPGLAGHEAVRAILATSPHSHVIVYTSLDAPAFERDMLTAGATAVVLKVAPMESLVRVVEQLPPPPSPT